MRHRLVGRKLGRNSSHRRSLFANMVRCILQVTRDDGYGNSGRIRTTLAKAKQLRPYLEKLVTISVKARRAADEANVLSSVLKKGDDEYLNWLRSDAGQKWLNCQSRYVHFQRALFRVLRSRALVEQIVKFSGGRFSSRQGGYTRVVKLAKKRIADGASMAYIEFVDDLKSLPVD